MKNTNKINIFYFIQLLKDNKGIFLFNLFSMFFIISIVSFILPQKFSSSVLILPPEETIDPLTYGFTGIGQGMVSSFTRSLMGGAVASEVWASILRSRRVQKPIIEKLNLQELWGTEIIEDAYEKLNSTYSIIITPEGILNINVTTDDKLLSKHIADELIYNLEKTNTELLQASAANRRIFIEDRLHQVEDSLYKTEQTMLEFNMKLGIINVEFETEPIILALSNLKAQEIIAEAEVAGYTTEMTSFHPQRRSAEAKLSLIRERIHQIEKGGGNGLGLGFSVPLESLPNISIQYARIKRDYIVQNTVYELLIQEFERAKINEQRNVPTLKVIDYPVVSNKKAWPKKSIFIIVGLLIGIATGFALIIVKNRTEEELNDNTKKAEYYNLIYKW